MTAGDRTQAAVLEEPGKPLRLRELEIPRLKPGQVLVDVAYSGVCHTQVLEVRGRRGNDKLLPHALGHEGSGTVRDVGPGVTKVKPGDRVVLTWIPGSGADVPGTTYSSSAGKVNSGPVSTFMTSTVTCENRLVPIPERMPFREAALLGCAIPTGAGIVLNTLGLKSGSCNGTSLAVFGAGGIGLSAILAASAIGVPMRIAVDIVEEKLDQATAAGATIVINAIHNDPVSSIREVTDGKGVDFAIEAAGKRTSMEAAFAATRHGGGICVVAGNLPHGEKISLDPMDLIKGRRIIGTWGGETVPDRDVPAYVEWFLAGKLDLAALITHEYPLAAVNEALEDLEAGKVGRAIIDLSADRAGS